MFRNAFDRTGSSLPACLGRVAALAAAALLSAALAAGPARAAVVAFGNLPTDPGNVGVNFDSGALYGGVFTSGATGAISSVSAYLGTDVGDVEVTMALYAWAGSGPGALLGSSGPVTVNGSVSEVSFAGLAGLSLVQGETYGLIAGPNSGTVFWVDGTVGNIGIASTDGGGTWFDYYNPALRLEVVPLPATLPLVLAGAGLLGLAARRRGRLA